MVLKVADGGTGRKVLGLNKVLIGNGSAKIKEFDADGIARQFSLERRLNVDTTKVSNVGSGEDDLITYSMPANTLANNGESVKIDAFGTTAANGNNKTIKLYLGSTELTSATAGTPNDQDWEIVALIIRTGAATGKSIVEYKSNTSSDNTIDYVSLTEDFTTALTIKCTGEGVADSDIVQEALLIDLIP